MVAIYDVLKASKGIHVDDTFAELWGRKQKIYRRILFMTHDNKHFITKDNKDFCLRRESYNG